MALTQSEISRITDISKIIGDINRLKIIQLLSTEKLCVLALADRIKISQPAVSQHLKILKNADILNVKKIGSARHYTINKNTLIKYRDDITKLIDCVQEDTCRTCPKTEKEKHQAQE